jgi:hypothetical protein
MRSDVGNREPGASGQDDIHHEDTKTQSSENFCPDSSCLCAFVVWPKLADLASGMTEAAGTALSRREFLDFDDLSMHHWRDHKLRYSFAGQNPNFERS